jgi:hypothetical protein
VRIALEIAGIAAAHASIEERAEATLESLHRAVPWQAAWLALRDPERRVHTPLATAGDAGPLRAYFQTPEADAEVELLGMGRPRPPMLHTDLPVPARDLRAWAEYLWPAGFRGGLAAGLFSPDGRHLGYLSLLTDTAELPTAAGRDLIGVLAPLVAHAVDRMRTIAAAASIVREATAGVVLTRAGNALPLPGLPGHPLLVPASAVLRVAAARLAHGSAYASFLCPVAGDHPGELVRVTVLDCGRGALDHLEAVVTVGPAGNLRGLTLQKVRALGLLAEGWPDLRIATALTTTVDAVAACLDRAVAALGAPNRTAAVVRAVREGLYVPSELWCS